ncbi:MAG: CotH kinase family protein [Nonlabens sp.]
MRFKLFILFTISFVVAHSQNLNIIKHVGEFGIDETRSLIITRWDDSLSATDLSNYSSVSLSLDNRPFTFSSAPSNLGLNQNYFIGDNLTGNVYTLYFTNLPLVSINSTSTIIDDPKVLADFTYADQFQNVSSQIGIELRGASSLSFPKKTYDLELWADAAGNDSRDLSFAGMRDDDDWVLDALYNEPLRIRSFLANKLWLDLHSPHYLNDEPNAKAGADAAYVELFVNGDYRGIYNLMEQVDKKQLQLKSYNGSVRGELYKGETWGASTFWNTPVIDNTSRYWGGFEMKYPDEDDITDWTPVESFVDFVIDSSNTDFNSQIFTLFNKENFIDYFIFLNLLRATDNTGKNIYLAKYRNGFPYFHTPWDLDGCFGTIYNGNQENITDDILSNGLISRILRQNPENVKETMALRWFELRNGLINDIELADRINTLFNKFTNEKIYERESLVYTNYNYDANDLNYIQNWITARTQFLDQYFGRFLSSDQLNKTEFKIYPNPARDYLEIQAESNLEGLEYTITNALGQMLRSGTISENEIDVNDLVPGIYLLSVDGNSVRFIKQ